MYLKSSSPSGGNSPEMNVPWGLKASEGPGPRLKPSNVGYGCQGGTSTTAQVQMASHVYFCSNWVEISSLSTYQSSPITFPVLNNCYGVVIKKGLDFTTSISTDQGPSLGQMFGIILELPKEKEKNNTASTERTVNLFMVKWSSKSKEISVFQNFPIKEFHLLCHEHSLCFQHLRQRFWVNQMLELHGTV